MVGRLVGSRAGRSALVVIVIGVSGALVSACGSSTPKASSSTPGQTTAGTGKNTSSSSTVSLGRGLTVALPRGWASQGPWNCCLGGSGQSVQNNKPGTGAVVADFAVNQAAKIPPNHPAPTSATAALNAWSTALGNNVSGVIANFQPNRVVTRPLSGPAFDQFAGHTYTGTLHGSPIAGFIVVLWNSRTKHNVMGWLISSGQSKAVAAEGDLNQMVASIAASN